MLAAPSNSIAIIADSMAFRGASVAALFAPWARAMGCDVVVDAPDNICSGRNPGMNTRFIVLSIGGMSLHGTQLMQWTEDIIDAYAGIPCVVVSDRTEPDEAILAARMGLQAFIPSSVHPELAYQVLAFVSSGGTYFPREALLRPQATMGTARVEVRISGDPSQLTPRQTDVLERLRLGRSNKHIGRDLDMSEATVKVHVRQIMRKFGAVNRTQAALFAAEKSPDPMPVGEAGGTTQIHA